MIRRLTKWLKLDFEFDKRNLNIYDRESLDEQLNIYTESKFPNLLKILTPIESKQFIDDMMFILFVSQRLKRLDYLPDPTGPNAKQRWNTILQVKDAFSHKRLDAFLTISTYAFLCAWLCSKVNQVSLSEEI